MYISLLLLLGSLVVLVAGAELLVRGSVGIAHRMGVSAFFIGLTIVGFGTSTPELSTSLIAAYKGAGDIAIGNVVGSNICNVLLILGATALVRPISIRLSLVRAELYVVVAVSLLPFVALATGSVVTRAQGLTMIVLLGLYVWRGYLAGRREQSPAAVGLEAEIERAAGISPTKPSRFLMSVLFIAAGLVLLVGGSWLLVGSASDLARGFGVSELVIGLTVVAVGTSAPELFTSIVAAFRKQSDIAIGNVLGSNVFNILGILGITSAVKPQAVDDNVFRFDLPMMLGAALLLTLLLRTGARLSRLEGVCMLGVYIAYVVFLYLAR